MIHRLANDRLEGALRLCLGGDHLVPDSAGGELDAVPRQHVCGDKLGESLQRPTAHLGRRPGFAKHPGKPVHGTHV